MIKRILEKRKVDTDIFEFYVEGNSGKKLCLVLTPTLENCEIYDPATGDTWYVYDEADKETIKEIIEEVKALIKKGSEE